MTKLNGNPEHTRRCALCELLLIQQT